MKSGTLALSAGLLLLLGGSLAGKFDERLAPFRPDELRLARDVAQRLHAAHFAVRLSPSFLAPRIDAASGACRIVVRDVAPSGENAGAVDLDLRGLARRRYLFGGGVYDRPPRLRAAAAFYLAREGSRLGMSDGWAPLLVVADDGECDGRLPDLSSIRAYPQSGG